MLVKYRVNNYILGAKVRITPTDQIVEQFRTDPHHMVIIYQLYGKQKEFVDKVLSQSGEVISEEEEV